MLKRNLFETVTNSLYQMLGNGASYKVPLYQRDYSWSEKHWEDLWEDINFALNNAQEHYMGTVVLQKTDSDKKIIIDGQQRLVTLTIFALAGIEVIRSLIEQGNEVNENNERIIELMREFVGNRDSASLKYATKLTLNANNNEFYRNHIANYKTPPFINKINNSEHLIWDCLQYFKKKILTHLSGKNGEKIASFIKDTSKSLIFITINVVNEDSAYIIFETLNARGEDLTATDLLKNYLFSKLSKSQSDLDVAQGVWNRIANSVTLRDFPRFLRYYINFQQNTIREEQLYAAFKKRVNSSQDVFSMLDDFQNYSYIYAALKNPNDDLWNNQQATYIELLNIFNAKQVRSLLMIAYTKLPEKDFNRLLDYLVTISFRYSVIGDRNPNELERIYNSAAQILFKEKSPDFVLIREVLRKAYIDDESFISSFANKALKTTRRKKLVKYILVQLEQDAREKENTRSKNIKYNDQDISIEHIWNKV